MTTSMDQDPWYRLGALHNKLGEHARSLTALDVKIANLPVDTREIRQEIRALQNMVLGWRNWCDARFFEITCDECGDTYHFLTWDGVECSLCKADLCSQDCYSSHQHKCDWEEVDADED